MARSFDDYTFDARPDRIDYRDREYQPQLVSLPERFPDPEFIQKYLPMYTQQFILDQGQEGACTGFGLAAVVNYLLWSKGVDAGRKDDARRPKLERVSARMLYHMAQVYDEWPGEDYEGSSCRGAMKGWHRHGVCSDELWPYWTQAGRISKAKPRKGWEQNAARRPLGAYYRVNKDSISDIQAAIYEVGAVYVSAQVHDGWSRLPRNLGSAEDALIERPLDPFKLGGHAFALVGYSERGFIVQNSWGPTWGYHGFAVLPYADWVRHGTDVWVAVMGAPMADVHAGPRTVSSSNLESLASGRAEWSWRSDGVGSSDRTRDAIQPASESVAYEHTVVLGNNGRPINRFLDRYNAREAVEEVALTLPRRWLRANGSRKLAVYAHGGLNNEEASLRRIRVMEPYFRANGVYPVFVTWRTGVLESIAGMLGDIVERFFGEEPLPPAEAGWLERIREQVAEARDRTIEVACERVLVKPVWTQMKQNASAAAEPDRGLSLMAGHLKILTEAMPDLEIHLIGHSAGSILHGELLEALSRLKVKVAGVSLYAPACTVRFAVERFARAVRRRQVPSQAIHCDLLSDERERADTVGPYGKSLLYLVSRALESSYQMPLLGMEAAWRPVEGAPADKMWNRSELDAVEQWQRFAERQAGELRVHGKERARVAEGPGSFIPLAHGSFDNDLEVVSATLERIRGAALEVPVTNLEGF